MFQMNENDQFTKTGRDKSAPGTAEKRPGVFPAGYNHGSRAEILAQYQVGRPIQWGAFTSVTTVRKQNTQHETPFS
eukprot:COSAG06_NODE_833_length_12029_cov_38.339868_3_plen_76_part_00